MTFIDNKNDVDGGSPEINQPKKCVNNMKKIVSQISCSNIKPQDCLMQNTSEEPSSIAH